MAVTTTPWPPLFDSIEDLFTYHPPQGDEPEQYTRIRAAAKTFAYILLANCPAGPDRAFAIRQIREAVMFANASIATRNAAGRYLEEERRAELAGPGGTAPPDVED
jgi:hypothetical protein